MKSLMILYQITTVSAALAEALIMQANSIFCGSLLTCIGVASHFFPALLIYCVDVANNVISRP